MSPIHSRGYLTHVDGADIQFISYRMAGLVDNAEEWPWSWKNESWF